MVDQADRASVHIDHAIDDEEFRIYHRVVADAAARLTPPGGRAVDIGAGLGHVLALLAETRPDIELTAVDTDAVCLARIRSRLPGAETVELDVNRELIEGVGTGFATAMMCHSLEHLLNPPQAIEAALATLQPGGHLILAVPNPVRPLVFLGNVRKQHYVNRGHVYSWDPSHWRNFLEGILGLHVVEYLFDEVRVFPRSWVRKQPVLAKFEIWLSRLVPWWSFSNIAVVRRESAAVA